GRSGGHDPWLSDRIRQTTLAHHEWPGPYCGPYALCDIFCVKVAACLFSFRRRCGSSSSWRGVFTRGSTTATTTRTTAVRTVATGRTTRTALFVTRSSSFRRQFAVRQHVALVDPDFDTDDAVGSLGFGSAVVDVGAQGVQGHTAFAIPFGTGNFDTVQTARAHDLDALGTQAHGILHGAFHGAAELYAFFKLLRDGIGNQLSVGFGLADFFDVDVHGHAHKTLKVGLEAFDVFAAFTDND